MVKLIKIGGSLLKEKNTFNLLKNILDKEINNHNKIILVVSAIGRNNDPYATDTLKKLGANLNKLDYNYIMGIGEIISTLITASNLSEYNLKVVRYYEIGIRKKGQYILNDKKLVNYLKDYDLLIASQYLIYYISNFLNIDISKPTYNEDAMKIYFYKGEL